MAGNSGLGRIVSVAAAFWIFIQWLTIGAAVGFASFVASPAIIVAIIVLIMAWFLG